MDGQDEQRAAKSRLNQDNASRRRDRRTCRGLSFNQKLQAVFQGLIFFVTLVYTFAATAVLDDEEGT